MKDIYTKEEYKPCPRCGAIKKYCKCEEALTVGACMGLGLLIMLIASLFQGVM
jgi:hypothetical protein